jgi:hypothetical protein
MRRVWLLPTLVAAAMLSSAHAQISGPASSGGPATVPPGFQAWSNPELHLTWLYPAELTPVDGAFAITAAQRMLHGEDAELDPTQADTCAKVLLSVGNGTEGKGQWARVGLVAVNGQCFPAKVLQSKKATQMLLRNLVSQGTTVMGMMPVEDQPAGYQIEGHWATFSAAQGEPVGKSDVQTSDQQVLGVVAVQAEGRILGWVLETNDEAMFNRLLGSGVDFGTGKPEPLFGGGVR